MRIYPTLQKDRRQILGEATGWTSMAYEQNAMRTGAIPTVAAASGQIVGSLIGLRAGDTVNFLGTYVSTGGTGLTFAKMALTNTAGQVLVATASVSATFNTTAGYKQVAVTSPYTVGADGGYYVVYLQYGSGATGATIGLAAGSSVGNTFSTYARPCVQVTALATDLTGTLTFADATNSYWVAAA